MKEYIYQNHRLYIFLLTTWILISIIGLLILAPSYMSFLFWLGLISTVVALLTIPQIFSKKIMVNDTGILESEKKIYLFYKKKEKELRWDEIGYIFDDYVQPILFYPFYKLHIFHLMPKDSIIKPFKRISISWWIKNYKKLISEVISKVNQNTYIDDYILNIERSEKEKRKRKWRKRGQKKGKESGEKGVRVIFLTKENS